MSQQGDKIDNLKPLPMEAVAEDLFGINLRGLHSIASLWVRPRLYFDAARYVDWKDSFTPSIRLWLFFFAVFSAFKVLWIGNGEGMIAAYAKGFSAAQIRLPLGQSYTDMAREALFLIFGILPFLQIVGSVILACVYPFWGQPTTMALRQRYFFGVIVPSASLMPVFMTTMMFVPSEYLTAYGLILALVTFLIDFQTGFRGSFSRESTFGRLWRAAMLGLIVVGLNAAMTIIAQIIGIIYINQKYGVLTL